MTKSVKETLRKLLITASLGGFLTGCATLGENTDSPDKPAPSGTLSAEQIPLEDINTYFNIERDIGKDNPENYKKDMMFVYRYAQQQHKEFFEFDGTTYRTDETPLAQIDALLNARKNGKKTYIFDGEEKEACSYYPADSQIKIFGNLWEELRSPQSEQTKKLIRTLIHAYTFPTFHNIMLNRVYEICRLSGYPEVKCETTEQSLMGKIIEMSSDQKRAHYEPSAFGRGTIYLVPQYLQGGKTVYRAEELFAELAHAFRNNNNFFGETSQFFGDAFKDIITLNSAGVGVQAQDKNYRNKDRMEYDTHKIVEPELIRYIQGTIPSIPELYAEIEKKRKENGNRYTLTPSASQKVKKGKNMPKGISVPVFGYIRTLKEK